MTTGAPGIGKSAALAAAQKIAVVAGAEILSFDGRIEPIDLSSLAAILVARGWVEPLRPSTFTLTWTKTTVKRIVTVDHIEESSRTLAWLTDPRTKAALCPNVALVVASRHRVQTNGVEVIHIRSLPPQDMADHNAGFPGLLPPMDSFQRSSAETALADKLLAESATVLEALCLVTAATPDAISAIAGQSIPREVYATLRNCSWIEFQGRWLLLEGAAASVIRRDFAVSAPERYAEWLKRAGNRAAKMWHELTLAQRAWLAASLGASANTAKPDSPLIRLPDAARWHVERHEKGYAETLHLPWTVDSSAPVWVLKDEVGAVTYACSWHIDRAAMATAQFVAAEPSPAGSVAQMARLMASALLVDLLSSATVGWVSPGSELFGAMAALIQGTPLVAESRDNGLRLDCRSETPARWLSALVSPNQEVTVAALRPIAEPVVRSALRGFHRVSYLNDLARDHQLDISGKAFQDLMLGILVAAEAPSPLSREHQRVLRVTYVEKPGTADAIAARLAMSRTTYYRQLAEAQARMAEALMAVAAETVGTEDDRTGFVG